MATISPEAREYAKFFPGTVVYTRRAGALYAPFFPAILHRHLTGDWGELSDDDKAENEYALENGERLFSSYVMADGERVWIITEADRSSTTILLPEEY